MPERVRTTIPVYFRHGNRLIKSLKLSVNESTLGYSLELVRDVRQSSKPMRGWWVAFVCVEQAFVNVFFLRQMLFYSVALCPRAKCLAVHSSHSSQKKRNKNGDASDAYLGLESCVLMDVKLIKKFMFICLSV